MQTRTSRGFTLPELLIALSITAVLLAGAVPAFTGLIQRQRLDGARQVFLTALAFTKQEAIKRNADVALCPSRDGATCLQAGHWHHGWIVFEDSDEDREPDTGEPPLLRHGRLEPGIALTSSKHRRVITFQPTGTAGGSNATFTFCNSKHPGDASKVVLSILGRVRWENDPADACPPKK